MDWLDAMTTDIIAKLTEMLEQERKMTPVPWDSCKTEGYELHFCGYSFPTPFEVCDNASAVAAITKYGKHTKANAVGIPMSRNNIKPLVEFALAVERALLAKFPVTEIRAAQAQLEKDLA